MKKRFNIFLSISLGLGEFLLFFFLVILFTDKFFIDIQHLVHPELFGEGVVYGTEGLASQAIKSIFLLLCLLGIMALNITMLFFINRADLSELMKSTLQARRERKAARLEAEKQRKIEKAKKTLAELDDDKEKVSE